MIVTNNLHKGVISGNCHRIPLKSDKKLHAI